MGNFPGKKESKLCEKDVRILTEKIRLLRKEINGMMQEREKESKAYEREAAAFAFKEAEWKQERKKLKEEAKRLRKNLEEKEERIREMKLGRGGGGGGGTSSSLIMEHMKEERSRRRDQAVEKWKQLYLEIKTELDGLIQTTHNGNGVLYWQAEEDEMIQELKRELRYKEQTIEALKAEVGFVQNEVIKRERDFDILKQSFKISSCKRKAPCFSGSKCMSFSQKLHL